MDPSRNPSPAGLQAGRLWIGVGCLMLALAVASGAIGAHGLEAQLEGKFTDLPQRLAWWETASHYQLLHGLGFVCLGIVLPLRPRWIHLAAAMILVGVVLFSGSLYCLAVTPWRFWGMVAPLGGLSLILGWGVAGIGMLFPTNKAIQRQ